MNEKNQSHFTPGPWEVSVGNSGSIFGDLNNPIHDGDNPYIGTVHGIDVDSNYPECKANARLIASAPEMYDLLKELSQISGMADQVMFQTGNVQRRAIELLNRINNNK